MIIDQLLIGLGIDAEDAHKEVEALEKGFDNLIKIGSRVAGAFGVKKIIDGFREINRTVTTLSSNLGEDYETIQVWGEAVKTTGGSVDGLNSSLETLNSGIQEAAINGTSSLLPALNRLGVSMYTAGGELKVGTEILSDLSNVFDKLTDRQATTFGRQLGLDGGTIMLLKKGATEVENILEKQRLLGIYTKEDGEIAQDFSNSLDDLSQVLKSVTAVFARMALPVLDKFNEMMMNIALFIRKYENFIKGFFIGLALAIGGSLIPKIFALGKAFLLLNSSLGIITLIAGAIGLIIDDFITWKEGGDALFGSLYKGFSRLSNAVQKFKDDLRIVWDFFKEFAKDVANMPVIKQIIGAGAYVGEKASGLFGNKEQEVMNTIFNNQTPINQSNISNSATFGKIEIYTQATDSKGIAQSIIPELQKSTSQLTNLNNGY